MSTLNTPAIGLNVAPFGVTATKHVAEFLAVTCEPRFGDAAPPSDRSGGDAMRLGVRPIIQVLTIERLAHAAQRRLSCACLVDCEGCARLQKR